MELGPSLFLVGKTSGNGEIVRMVANELTRTVRGGLNGFSAFVERDGR